jgi:Holliday junction resolvase RusA-like endonuclease
MCYMMNEVMRLRIPGKPMTWKRVEANFRKGLGKPTFHNPDAMMRQQGHIGLMWRGAGHKRLPDPVDVGMQVEFVFPRPKHHYGTGKNAGVLKDSCRHLRPRSGKYGGDTSNLVKLVEDALNAVGYDDDAQIVETHAVKRYIMPGEDPHTMLVVVALDDASMYDTGALEPIGQMELALAA